MNEDNLFIFRFSINAFNFTARASHGYYDWAAADAAVFNVFLTAYGAVYGHFNLLPAIGALEQGSLEFSHEQTPAHFHIGVTRPFDIHSPNGSQRENPYFSSKPIGATCCEHQAALNSARTSSFPEESSLISIMT